MHHILLICIISSIVSFIFISDSLVPVSTSPGLIPHSIVVVIGLIILISLKLILCSSELWNPSLSNYFNISIASLLICFAEIVVLKIGAIK